MHLVSPHISSEFGYFYQCIVTFQALGGLQGTNMGASKQFNSKFEQNSSLWPLMRRRDDYASIRTPITVPTQETLLCFGQQKHVLHGHWANLIQKQSPICKKLCITIHSSLLKTFGFFCRLSPKFIPSIITLQTLLSVPYI